jgi:hypothetical protein
MIDVEIRELVAQHLDGDLSADALEDQLETEAWVLEDEPARTLAATVLRLLSEFTNGDWTDSELDERLGAITRSYRLEQASPRAFTGTATSTVTQVDQQSEVADRRLAAGSV